MLIVRLPILDRDRRVFAYQLRLQPLPAAPGGRQDSGHPSVAEALDRCGLDTLTLGRPAFLRIPSAQLVPAVREAFPPRRVVIEVPYVAAERQMSEECRALKEYGYAVALDDFRLTEGTAGCVDLADFIKVDFLPSTSAHTRACVEVGHRAEAALVAKSIDAIEVFDEAVREGFTFFQGQLFEERRLLRGQTVRSGQLASLALLQALADPSLSIGQIENLVKRDAALSYRVLRLVNSAGSGLRREVSSMHEALLLVGRDTVRRWASVAVITGLGCDTASEILVMAVVRARFCELAVMSTGGAEAAGEGFLVGLCSMLDVILGRSMPDILDDLPLTLDLRAALFGRDNRLRRLLDCVMAYERADWANCLSLAGVAGLNVRALAPSYIDALRFAYELRARA
jgi:EAL and modified HD-GYP domain-containing signal transduction protein